MRQLRKAQNMSLRTLEKLTGLNRGYLSRMERGHIQESADQRVQAIAAALKAKPAAIQKEEDT